jgi:Ca2+-dependent lipid-binding protein
VLVIVLVKARDLPTNEADEFNYYIIINLFPQKHKPFQSAVYRTSSPEFGESFEFPIPPQYLLFQNLKFSFWSFDRFSQHDVIADTLVQLPELETYGLSIGRDVSVAKKLRLVRKASNPFKEFQCCFLF